MNRAILILIVFATELLASEISYTKLDNAFRPWKNGNTIWNVFYGVTNEKSVAYFVMSPVAQGSGLRIKYQFQSGQESASAGIEHLGKHFEAPTIERSFVLCENGLVTRHKLRNLNEEDLRKILKDAKNPHEIVSKMVGDRASDRKEGSRPKPP